MDILTLLRANIKRKKGTFFGIVILMIIVSMLLITLISVKKNVLKSIDDAYEEVDAGDVDLNISSEYMTPELLSSVKNHPLVERVETCPAILMRKHFIGDQEDNQSWLIVEQNSVVKKQFEDVFSAYKDHVEPVSDDGIYLTQGIATNTGCKVGDSIRFITRGGEYTFTIEGFVVEPVCGSSMVGWKTVYVSHASFEKLKADVDNVTDSDIVGNVDIVYLYKTADCGLSDGEFAKKINQDTGIQNFAYASSTKTQMKYYTSLFSEMICSIMIVFAVILAGVVVIIMAHNISVTIDMSYTELGILKAQGFTKSRIRVLYALQYILAQIVGAVIGTILAIPMIAKFGDIFQPITAIRAENRVDVISGMLILLVILLISFVIVLLATRKIGKVSPVKALTGERADVYFESLLTAPVTGKGLSLSLAYRQFSSNKRRYIVAILICALLMFFMLTVNLMGSCMKSKKAMEAMGQFLCEVEIRPKEGRFTEEEIEMLTKTVQENCDVDKIIFETNQYVSLNDTTIMMNVYRDPSLINTSSGRAPLYDNEIVITDIVADSLGITVGDKVEITSKDKKAEYIVSGKFNCLNDTGMVFAMGEPAAKKIGFKGFLWFGASLNDSKNASKAGAILEEKFGNTMNIYASEDAMDEADIKSISTAVEAMRYLIYVFSVIFTLVVVSMICSKIFTQERRDLGIYKAVGFTSGKLRLLFAMRFLIVGIIGSAIGCALSFLFSNRALRMALRSVGVTNFLSNYSAETIVIPVVLLLISFFLFAYIVSRKVKKVEIRELVIE